jgi:TATA-box binding protein (TBP) (component of TFIID and TFIIIB)
MLGNSINISGESMIQRFMVADVVTLKMREWRVSVFLSGKMISTGGNSVNMSIRQLKHALDLFVENRLANSVIHCRYHY